MANRLGLHAWPAALSARSANRFCAENGAFDFVVSRMRRGAEPPPNISAEAAAQAFGAMETYDDFLQLVRSNNVDIVTVCVRVPFHLDVVMAALEAGKHVMCEWPLGRDIGEAEKMAEAARTAGVRTCIGLQGRMALAAQRAREMLSTGAIGPPLTASIYVPNTAFGPQAPAYLAYLTGSH